MNEEILNEFNGNPAATPEAIASFERSTELTLPSDYKEFMRCFNGGEGFVGDDSYIILWQIEELEEFNREYEVAKYCDGVLLIGSSGGGEAYGFDTRQTTWPIVQVPFVGMDTSLLEQLGSSFAEFLAALSQKNPA